MSSGINEYDIQYATKRDSCCTIDPNHLDSYEETSNGKWWLFQYFCMSYVERRRMNNLYMDVGQVFYKPTTRNYCGKFNQR